MKKTLIAAAVMAALHSATAAALGLGPITVRSGLGEPFSAEIALISNDPNELDQATFRGAKLAAYERQGMAFSPAMAGLQIKMDLSKPRAPKLQLSTAKPVSDLGFHVIVDGTSPAGGYTRAYAVILQPTGEMFARNGTGGSIGAAVADAVPPTAARPLQIVEPKIPKYDRVMSDVMIADASAASTSTAAPTPSTTLSDAERDAAHAQALAIEAPPTTAGLSPMAQADEERAAARRAALDRAAQEDAERAAEQTRLEVSLAAQQTEEAGHLHASVAGIASAHLPTPAGPVAEELVASTPAAPANETPLYTAGSSMYFEPYSGAPGKIEDAQTQPLAPTEPVVVVAMVDPAPAPAIETAVPVLPDLVAAKPMPTPGAPSASPPVMQNVTMVGTPPAKITVVAGKERTQPLGAALRAITPAGWSGHFDPNDTTLRAALGTTVTWSGGQLWTIALNDVMQQAGLLATVDWKKKDLGFASKGAPSNEGGVAKAAPAPVVLTRVLQKNGAPATAAKVGGGTRTQPLGAALRAITPKGWSGYFDTKDAQLRAAIGKTVTWTGGKPWPEILDGLMEQSGLTAELDWKKLELALKRVETPVAAEPPVVVAVAVETAPATPAPDTAAADRAAAEQAAADAASKAAAEQAARDAEQAAAAKAAADKAAADQAAAEQAAAQQAAAEQAAAAEAARVAAQQREAEAAAAAVAAKAQADAEAAEQARVQAEQQAAAARQQAAEQAAAQQAAAQREAAAAQAARDEAARVAAAKATPPAAVLPAFQNMVTTGTPPATIEAAQGGVANIALQPALERLVPSGWKLFVRTGSTTGALPATFSWSGGGRPWLTVMDQALGQAGMVAYVDFTRKEVALARR